MTYWLASTVESERMALALGLVVCLIGASAALFMISDSPGEGASDTYEMFDPLLQDEGHDHRNASQHMMYTDNIQPVSFNALTAPGNAEVQVADSPDGKTYAYIAGWSEMHIVDVTDPSNTTVTVSYTHLTLPTIYSV